MICGRMFGKRGFMKKILTILFVLLISRFVFAQEKFAEYGNIIPDDEFSVLLNAGEKAVENKESRIYVLINKEKKMPIGKFLRYFYGVRTYIQKNSNLPEGLVIVEAGEEKDTQLTRIWIVKKGETLPVFNTIPIEDRLTEKIAKKTLFDQNCYGCDESPFIKQFIFREGLDNLAKIMRANMNCKALLKIPLLIEYPKRERIKEKNELRNEIVNRLTKQGISPKRLSIQFVAGDNAKFYLIPKIAKR
jgi:hypothetical protein